MYEVTLSESLFPAQEGDADRLTTIYLSYLHHAQAEDGHFKNFMDFRRNSDRERGSEDCEGRALWALGLAVKLAPNEGCLLYTSDAADDFAVVLVSVGAGW